MEFPGNPQVDLQVTRAREDELARKAELYADRHSGDGAQGGPVARLLARVRAALTGRSKA
jgi:hypothetical protein